MFFMNQDSYQGGWHKGKRQGMGNIRWESEMECSGPFENDMMMGDFSCYLGQTLVFRGKFEKNKLIEKYE